MNQPFHDFSEPVLRPRIGFANTFLTGSSLHLYTAEGSIH
jgi:hypothetical protein